VTIAHDFNNDDIPELYSVYAHLKTAPYVSKGDFIFGGDQIGLLGSTGNSEHFEIRKNEEFLNPNEYLDFK